MFVLNELRFNLRRLKDQMNKFTSEEELLKMLQNYKNNPEMKKIEEIMIKDIDYKIANMSGPNDKSIFRNINDIDYKLIFDEHPFYSVGIFILPKNSIMPIHDHRSMMVYTKVVCGKAEMKSYDKISHPDLDENEFEVKLNESKIYTHGDMSILTPSNKNIHQMTALEDTAFFDVLIPDYTERNTCSYFKLINVQNKTFLNKIKYAH